MEGGVYHPVSVLFGPHTWNELAMRLGAEMEGLKAQKKKVEGERKRETEALRAMLAEASKKVEEEKSKTSTEMARVLGDLSHTQVGKRR